MIVMMNRSVSIAKTQPNPNPAIKEKQDREATDDQCHRHLEVLRADLVQDERRKHENRQHEIQQDDLELCHDCTFAAGELDPSVAPRTLACAGA